MLISIIYLAIFLASITLVFRDKSFATVKEPCLVCMPWYLIVLSFACLLVGAIAFTFFGTRDVWVISAVMTLSISGFMLGLFFEWELKKRNLALLQIAYALVITIQFYFWWF